MFPRKVYVRVIIRFSNENVGARERNFSGFGMARRASGERNTKQRGNYANYIIEFAFSRQIAEASSTLLSFSYCNVADIHREIFVARLAQV